MWLLAGCLAQFLIGTRGEAGESARIFFDLPAGEAIETLKRAARQAGLEIMYVADTVRDVRTDPVRGEYTARQALDPMVARTPLRIATNEQRFAPNIKNVIAGISNGFNEPHTILRYGLETPGYARQNRRGEYGTAISLGVAGTY